MDIVGTPLAALTRIVATGDKEHVFNGVCGAESGQVPVSAAAPAMLFSEMEVQKRQHSHDRPPILPPPGFDDSTTAKASQTRNDAKPDVSPAMAAAHAAAKGDALLEALLTELERSKAQLKIDQVQSPYYIEYRVNDLQDFIAEAAFGAVRESQRSHVRVLRVVVRLGDYKQDSYYAQGQGETNILPLDNDPIALRHQIWLATDDAYKAAGQALAEKQAALKQFSADLNPVDDFAKAPVVTDVGATVELKVDEPKWKKTLEEMTSLYQQYSDVQFVSASARFSAGNEYFVNSEGTVSRHGKETYAVQFSGSAQAADGMRLARSPAWMVARAQELPTREALLKDAKETLDTLVALRQAPIVEEEYRGPVLFAPDAANDVVASLIPTGRLERSRRATRRACCRRFCPSWTTRR